MYRAGANADCQKAKVYYYDYLSDQQDQVPVDILIHISNCAHCRQEVEALQKMDEQAGSCSPVTSAQTAHLELHFALANQPIDCATIRPFLPVMAIPEQRVSIPTPVTVHLEHCRQCGEQLKILEELDLSVLEYGQVSQVFSSGAQRRIGSLSESQMKIIVDMLQSPDSGVVTYFRFKKESGHPEQEQSFDVEVLRKQDPPAEAEEHVQPTGSAPPAAPLPPRSVRRNRFLRPLAAAAVLVVGIVLLFQSSSVQATDIGQIYETLKTVVNIKMTHYGEDLSAPVEEVWISRSLGLKLVQTEKERVLFDVKNKIKIENASGSTFQSTRIDSALADAVEKTMNVPWGLLPFKNVDELPAGAVWEKVYEPSVTVNGENTDVFDLFWTEQTVGGAVVSYQWRCILDQATKRPIRTQWRQKNSADGIYELTTTMEITYPSEEQVQSVARQLRLPSE